MNRISRPALLLGSTLIAAGLQAQQPDPVDIGLFQTGSNLEIRVRPSAPFDGIVSAILYTVRSENGTSAELGTLAQKNASRDYVPTSLSGAKKSAGAHDYHVYAGFGMEPLSASGVHWEAGKEYVVATIPISGQGTFALVNDAWTREHNGDFYISLDGYDHTGQIYRTGVNNADAVELSISPNPSRGIFKLVIPVAEGEKMSFEIVNAAGQIVQTRQPETISEGAYREELDLTSQGPGNYLLRITRDGATETHKIMIN